MLIGKEEMSLQEVQNLVEAQAKELKEKNDSLKVAQEKLTKLSEEATPATETPAEEKPAETPAPEATPATETPTETPAEEKPAEEGKAMSEIEKRFSEKELKLNEKIVALQEKGRRDEVEKTLHGYANKGVAPAAIEVAKNLMFSDIGSKKEFKFSEDGKAVSISLSDAVLKMLDLIPQISLGERTLSESNGSNDVATGSDYSEDRVKIKELMEKEKISYMDSYRKLFSEGKVNEVKVFAN